MPVDAMFSVVPKMLWPPCAVLALIGCALLLWKERSWRTVFLTASFGFAWLWRSAMSIESSRYAAGMVLPALGLAVYALVKVADEWPRLKLPVVAGFAILIGIAGAKDFFRPASPYIMRAALRLEDLRRHGEPVYVPEVDAGRYGYYLHSSVAGYSDKAKDIFALFRHAGGPLFVVVHTNSGALLSDEPGAVLLDRILRRHGKEVRIYRYEPSASEPLRIPANAVNEFINPDLERSAGASEELDTLLERYRQRGYEFYGRPEFRWPLGWHCWIPRSTSPEMAPEFSLCSEEPISDGSSLRIRWRRGNQICSDDFPAGNYRFAFSVKGKRGTAFSLWVHASDSVGKWLSETPLAYFALPEDGVSRFTVEVPEALMASSPRFRIGFFAEYAELQVDDVVLARIPPIGTSGQNGEK